MIKATPSVMNINSNKSNSGNKFMKEHTEYKLQLHVMKYLKE